MSRFKENGDWIADLAAQGARVTIYDKGKLGYTGLDRAAGSNIQIVSLPNIGREADSYLTHICERYNTLSDTTVFLQADPWPHLKGVPVHHRNCQTMIGLAEECRNANISKPLGDKNVLNEASPPPFHMRVDVSNAAHKILGEVDRRPAYIFSAGAQYVVKKDDILAHPVRFWEKVREMLSTDEVNAWEIERLWMYLFGMVK